MTIIAKRYHDFSMGHRVWGHENKCAQLHGHNYRITFHCMAESLDNIGRVLDFGDIKTKLCNYLEDKWDHKFMLWKEDPVVRRMPSDLGVIVVPFNPTAENIGLHLIHVVGPLMLSGTGVTLIQVDVEETRKCSVTVTAEPLI